MTYRDHLRRGLDLDGKSLTAYLHSLGADERFTAVVAMLENNREAFIRAASSQELSGDHGRLAHAHGSIHALTVLIAQLTNILEPPARQGGIPRPDSVG